MLAYIGVEIWFKHSGFNELPWENAVEQEMRSDSIPHPRPGEAAPFLPYQQHLYCPFPSPWLPMLSGGVGGGREPLCVRQINLLSVSGPICRRGQSALGGDAAQQIESNRD